MRRSRTWITAVVVGLVLLVPIGKINVDNFDRLNPDGLAVDACAALPAADLARRLQTREHLEEELTEQTLTASNADTVTPFSYRSSCRYAPRSPCAASSEFPPLDEVTLVINGMSDPDAAKDRFQLITANIFSVNPDYSHRTRFFNGETGRAGATTWVISGREVGYIFHENHFIVGIFVTFCDLPDPAGTQMLVIDRLGRLDEPLDQHVHPAEDVFKR